MNRTEVLELLNCQKDNLEELDRSFRNYKKDGSHRKTERYLLHKYQEITDLWSEIKTNNITLVKLGVINQPYFEENSFEKARVVYDKILTDIKRRLSTIQESNAGNSSHINDNSDSDTPTHSSESKSERGQPQHQSTMSDDGDASQDFTNQQVAMFNLKLAEIETFLTEGGNNLYVAWIKKSSIGYVKGSVVRLSIMLLLFNVKKLRITLQLF